MDTGDLNHTEDPGDLLGRIRYFLRRALWGPLGTSEPRALELWEPLQQILEVLSVYLRPKATTQLTLRGCEAIIQHWLVESETVKTKPPRVTYRISPTIDVYTYNDIYI